MKKELIENVPVDSGGLIIVDPCYLSQWKDGEYGKDNHYTKACEARDDENNKEFLVADIAGNAVGFSSGYGDGYYPVYAHTNKEGRIMKIEVIFD